MTASAWIRAWWYYDVLYKQFGQIPNSPVLVASILFGSLLVPTFLMGMTLPLLSKALTPAIEFAGHRIGSVYALNTAGAAAGALTTAWILMGRVDFREILKIGASVNLAVGLLALVPGLILSRVENNSFLPEPPEPVYPVPGRPVFSFSTWALIYGLSGFLELSLEMAWFRILGVLIHPDPKEIAVIGMGSGDTIFSLGGRAETKEITCIEIVESQLDGLRLLYEKQPYGGLKSLLNDPRIKHVTGDGRRYLAASQFPRIGRIYSRSAFHFFSLIPGIAIRTAMEARATAQRFCRRIQGAGATPTHLPGRGSLRGTVRHRSAGKLRPVAVASPRSSIPGLRGASRALVWPGNLAAGL